MSRRRAVELAVLALASVCAFAPTAASSTASRPVPHARVHVSLTLISDRGHGGRCPAIGATTPQIAISASHPGHEAISWETGTGAAEWIAITSDGGRRWREHPVAGTTECDGGPNGDIVDPYLAMPRPASALVTSSWVTNSSAPAAGNAVTRVYLSHLTSRSGGGNPIDLDDSKPGQRAPIAVNPADSRDVAIEIEHITSIEPIGYDPVTGASIDVLVSYDGGHSFAPPVTIASSIAGESFADGGLVWTSAGLVAIVQQVSAANLGGAITGAPVPSRLIAFRSTDGGSRFASGTTIGEYDDTAFAITGGGNSPSGCCIADLAARADQIAAVWDDPAGPVHVAISRNGGASWVASMPVAAPHGSSLAAVTVLPHHRLAIEYDDRWQSSTGQDLARPYLFVTAGHGQPAVSVPLAAAFDFSQVTDGNDDTGTLGPEQDIASSGNTIKVVMPLVGQRGERRRDVEVYQAVIHLPTA